MSYKIVISIAALEDIEQAIDWYEEQLDGLGNRIKENIYESLSEIESNPHLSSKRYKEIRIRLIKLFPYVVHYSIEGNMIKVFGVFHIKRNPTNWYDRLK